MTDPRLVKLANILVNYSVKVKKGDWVLVYGEVTGLPLLREVIREVLHAGGHPNLLIESNEINEILLNEASEEQIQWISPVEDLLFKQIDSLIRVEAASNTRALSSVPPAKQRLRQQARRELTQTYMQRAANNEMHWVLTQYPCAAFAQEADMSLRQWEDFIYKATFADQPDPIQCWQEVHDKQAQMIEWLQGKKNVVVRGPNSDLTLSIAGRTFINSDGSRNMPSGEIYTGPVEESANGWIRFTYPAIRYGREVTGAEFQFEDGKVVNAKAEKNEEFLRTMLDSDEGSRYLGEFAIGTNYAIQQFTKSILFDEKIGGSIHLAVGAGYPDTGSKNRSSIHWDFICDMRTDSEILVDGELFYKNGEFQI